MSMQTSGTVATPANPYAPPRAAVRDILTPVVGAEPAERGTRFAAAFVDGMVFGLMVYAPLFLVAFGADNDSGGTMASIGFLLTFVGFAAWSWLTILYVTRNGQSIGKKLLNIKVVRSDGSAASFGRVFWLRNVVNGVISVVPFYALVDVLFIFGESQRCLHDKIADTIVIKA
jgi:uncharacterized RDD family membrane protein YckC